MSDDERADATDHLARALEEGRRQARCWMTVTVEVCGDPAVGLWCPHHALPHRAAIVLLLNGRPRIHHLCLP